MKCEVCAWYGYCPTETGEPLELEVGQPCPNFNKMFTQKENRETPLHVSCCLEWLDCV